MSQDQEKNTNEELPPTNLPNLQMQALLREMGRMMRVELEHIHERLDRVEEGTQWGQPPFAPNAPRRHRLHQKEVEDFDEFEGDDLEEECDRMSMGSRRRYGRDGEARNSVDNNLRSIKMKIPTFQGKSDPESYLEWEKKMELVFDCHNYSELKKVKLAAIEFTNYEIGRAHV